MMKKILLLVISVFTAQLLYAQEFNAKVQVMHDRIQNVDAKVFNQLKQGVQEFINSRKWTTKNFAQQEKIDCSILINITKSIGQPEDHLYNATISIQASRPVFNTSYNTTTFNFMDKQLSFKYMAAQAIVFNQNRIAGNEPMVANLPAVIAYYMNVILGLDYDSFSPKGGDIYFKRAQNIVMNAPEETRNITGWKANDQNKKNRYFLIEQIMNPRFGKVRSAWYQYHRLVLDKMSDEPTKSLKQLPQIINDLKQVSKENPTSIYLESIFNAKSNELIGLVGQVEHPEKKQLAQTLQELDVPNASKYRRIK